ncbi:MAG: hypothetical protein LBF54_03485 [Holosporaceae bacterium]|nr:hypothetical protein [Holosporaceae bacterium]
MINKTVIGFLGGIIGTSAIFSQVEGMKAPPLPRPEDRWPTAAALIADSMNEAAWLTYMEFECERTHVRTPAILFLILNTSRVPENVIHLLLHHILTTDRTSLRGMLLNVLDPSFVITLQELVRKGANKYLKAPYGGPDGGPVGTPAEHLKRILDQDQAHRENWPLKKHLDVFGEWCTWTCFTDSQVKNLQAILEWLSK